MTRMIGDPVLEAVLHEVRMERDRQDALFGDQSQLPDGTGGDGYKHLAVVDRWACKMAAEQGTVTWRHILHEEVSEAFAESDPEKLRVELVQIAAVATAWAQALDRRAVR